jgi:hypothetical protein
MEMEDTEGQRCRATIMVRGFYVERYHAALKPILVSLLSLQNGTITMCYPLYPRPASNHALDKATTHILDASLPADISLLRTTSTLLSFCVMIMIPATEAIMRLLDPLEPA